MMNTNTARKDTLKQSKEDKERLDYAAEVVMQQAAENPDIMIPISRELAEHMGAFYDPAMDDLPE